MFEIIIAVFMALCAVLYFAESAGAFWRAYNGELSQRVPSDSGCWYFGESIIDWSKIPQISADSRLSDLEYAKCLLEAGADVNAKDYDDGQTPLMRAVWYSEDLELIRLLLESGADVNAKDNEGMTPLMFPEWEAHHGQVKGYLKNRAVLKLLIESGADVNAQNNYGVTALMIVAGVTESAEVLSALAEAGADVNAKSDTGITGLMCAAVNRKTDALRFFIDAGVDVNTKDNKGKTALMWAAENNHNSEIITLLLENGADTKIKDNSGVIARDYAGSSKSLINTDVFEYLQQDAFKQLLDDDPLLRKAARQLENLKERNELSFPRLVPSALIERTWRIIYRSLLERLTPLDEYDLEEIWQGVNQKLKDMGEEPIVCDIENESGFLRLTEVLLHVKFRGCAPAVCERCIGDNTDFNSDDIVGKLWRLKMNGGLRSKRLEYSALIDKLYGIEFGSEKCLNQRDIQDMEEIWQDINKKLRKVGEKPVEYQPDQNRNKNMFLLKLTKLLFKMRFE